MNAPVAVDTDRVRAFRLCGHNLSRRLPPGSMIKAAGACGIQNTPPGSAALSLHARVDGLTPADVDRAFEEDKTLLQTFSLRGATYAFPTVDAAIFTRGILPQGEDSLRFFVIGAGPALDEVGMSAVDAIRFTADALLIALDGRALTKHELAPELAEKISPELSSRQRSAWESPSRIAPALTLGEAIVRFCLYIIALEGTFCFATRHNAATYIRTDQWLHATLSPADPAKARAELVRRYLTCYGPSTPAHLAGWAGIAPSQANEMWRLVEGELTEVDYYGQTTWILRRDVLRFNSPSMPEGVRFLPPHDPYLQLRDRETIVPDRTLWRQLWKASGNPGAVMADGNILGIWRPQKKGRTLNVNVELFARASPRIRPMIEEEATSIASYKGCRAAKVNFTKTK